MKDGVNFSLSSDCPGLQVTTLDHDYEIAERLFGFSSKQLQTMVRLKKNSIWSGQKKRFQIQNVKCKVRRKRDY